MAGRAQAALGSAHSFFQLAMPQCSAKPINESISNVVIGLVLVVVASLGICLALYVQKVVHLRSDPETGLERIHFTRVPLWWAGVLGNAVSELVNLAALGFAPATLVAPLGCLCVVFNALTAVFWLGEPFFKRDLAGLLLISLGVGIVVLSQVRSPVEPLTVDSLKHVITSSNFALYLSLLVCMLLILVACIQQRYATRFCWVYLAESAVFASITTVGARAFASLCGAPLSGSWANAIDPEAWPLFWGALFLLSSTAVCSLILQNRAMVHFGNSEVVPVYFCFFSVGSGLGSAMVYQELCWPWMLLMLPGLLCCVSGVFCISFMREARISRWRAKQGVDIIAVRPLSIVDAEAQLSAPATPAPRTPQPRSTTSSRRFMSTGGTPSVCATRRSTYSEMEGTLAIGGTGFSSFSNVVSLLSGAGTPRRGGDLLYPSPSAAAGAALLADWPPGRIGVSQTSRAHANDVQDAAANSPS